jgi:hypothetical protein
LSSVWSNNDFEVVVRVFGKHAQSILDDARQSPMPAGGLHPAQHTRPTQAEVVRATAR